MGKAKHTRISQRMSQHIMWLKLSLGILASKEITYQDDMFIAHMNSLVNTFFLSQCLPVLPHSLTAQIYDLCAGDGENPDGSIHAGRGLAGTVQGQGGEIVFLTQMGQKKVLCSMLGKSGNGRRSIDIGKMPVIGENPPLQMNGIAPIAQHLLIMVGLDHNAVTAEEKLHRALRNYTEIREISQTAVCGLDEETDAARTVVGSPDGRDPDAAGRISTFSV